MTATNLITDYSLRLLVVAAAVRCDAFGSMRPTEMASPVLAIDSRLAIPR